MLFARIFRFLFLLDAASSSLTDLTLHVQNQVTPYLPCYLDHAKPCLRTFYQCRGRRSKVQPFSASILLRLLRTSQAVLPVCMAQTQANPWFGEYIHIRNLLILQNLRALWVLPQYKFNSE